MEDRVQISFDADPPLDERGGRFAPARPSVDAEPDRERDPVEDVDLEPGWEPV